MVINFFMIFESFLFFFDHSNACESMRSLVEIHNNEINKYFDKKCFLFLQDSNFNAGGGIPTNTGKSEGCRSG